MFIITRKYYLGLSFFLFLSTFCFSHNSICLQRLKAVAYDLESHKKVQEEKEFIKLYKNDPYFSKWLQKQEEGFSTKELIEKYAQVSTEEKKELAEFSTYNLTDYGKYLEERKNPKLPKLGLHHFIVGTILRNLPIRLKPKLTDYEETVLMLRKGDTVTFGDKKFTLGNYLGAGNTNHIFEIEGEPHKVIRIPFLTKSLAEKGYPINFTRYASALAKLPKGINLTRIYEEGKGYEIHGKVDGNEDGYEFLLKMEEMYSAQRYHSWSNEFYFKALKQMDEKNDPESADKFRKLRTQMDKAHRNFILYLEFTYLRNFVWDKTKKDWYLVDRETIGDNLPDDPL